MENRRIDQDPLTVAGTNINDVKSQNERSGLTFKDLNKIFEDEEIVGRQEEEKKGN